MGNPKTAKGEGYGYLTGILHLSPAGQSLAFGGFNTCPHATAQCAAACLNTAGRGGIPQARTDGHSNMIQAARVRKTVRFVRDREAFLSDLASDIRKLSRTAAKHGLSPAVRLNGTSDLLWERVRVTVDGRSYANIMEAFPKVRFYDYTKWPVSQRSNLPRNYSLTLSRSEETTDESIVSAVKERRNVAVVFSTRRGQSLPKRYLGLRIIDGDKTDLRFTDPKGVIVGLRAKGRAKRQDGGFVVNV